MTVVGIDDTDSRTAGMCTTYLAARLVDELAAGGADVERVVLVRLNPGVPYKTRGNAAVAVHTTATPDVVAEAAGQLIDTHAIIEEDRTAPGMVITAQPPAQVSGTVESFTDRAIRDHLSIADAMEVIEHAGYQVRQWGDGRGVIGALAAVGAWAGRCDRAWTVELITYREPARRGTPRTIDSESVFTAASAAYPAAWDTVDNTAEELVCVPHTPGPILYGIRGETAHAVRQVSQGIDAEPIEREQLFYTNQGTDDHLQPATLSDLLNGLAYRCTGTVTSAPTTREGGHVFFELSDDDTTVTCAAFEPTKRFRDHVRDLRVGDELTVCGEVTDGTLKLEKFAVRAMTTSTLVPPRCSECGNRMKSAGYQQGYRCRTCGTSAPQKVAESIDRSLEAGWYEVPPRARRHIAKPLIRGGFDAPIHPER